MGLRIVIYLAAFVAVVAIAFVLGPRVARDTTLTFDASAIGDDPTAYLERTEGAIEGIRPDLEKEIVWAEPLLRSRTQIAIVYVHGFSASKGEIRPLPDKVADALGANLYFTRLTGHGRDNAAMAQGSINAWVNDYAESLAIGRAIGEKVVVIAGSTGAALAVRAAATKGASDEVAAIALISPNFGVAAPGAWMLTMPWGKHIAELAVGKERGFVPRNAMHRQLWTWRYPTSAIVPMAALAELARDAPVEDVTIPALFIFSDADGIVRPDLTREVAARWGAPNEMVLVNENDDPDNHVIAGDALSPSTTDYLADRIVVWLQAILP